MKSISRRQLLGASVAAGLGAVVAGGFGKPGRAAAAEGPHHLIWVWQFTTDAAPNLIGERLRDHKLGIVLKTHDGLQWMADYDKSPFAISGPPQTETLANYYEGIGVPFHAWAVVHGTDPKREAKMAAEVLEAGARSIFLDIEPYAGFWRGTPADAVTFGKELRRLSPNGRVVLSIDPRPWTVNRIPIKEFAEFADEIAPQSYWRTFNTQANYTRFAETGFPVGPEGVTPEFLLHVSESVLKSFGLPLVQIGQGATPDSEEWRRFIDGAYNNGSNFVTVWRYGVTTPDIFNILRDLPPKLPPAPLVSAPTGGIHVVQEGETLGLIAAKYGASVDDIMAANSLTDVNYVYIGQQIAIPGLAASVTQASTQQLEGGGAAASSGGKYTVQDGDTLFAIANKVGASPDALASLNAIADHNILSVGQELLIP